MVMTALLPYLKHMQVATYIPTYKVLLYTWVDSPTGQGLLCMHSPIPQPSCMHWGRWCMMQHSTPFNGALMKLSFQIWIKHKCIWQTCMRHASLAQPARLWKTSTMLTEVVMLHNSASSDNAWILPQCCHVGCFERAFVDVRMLNLCTELNCWSPFAPVYIEQEIRRQ